jgi:hypothetical protein
MLTPDIAFEHCSNAAAVYFAQAPPYISYRVSTHVSAPAAGRSRQVDRAVSVRTKDDVAVIQDLPQGRNQLGHGFPITPAFDALSYFTLTWKIGAHFDVTSYVHDVTPLHFEDVPKSSADVVVFRLRQYRVDYADDSSDAPDGQTHLTLRPYDYVKHAVAKPDSTFFLSDLYIDNASDLPAKVRYQGGDEIDFVLTYARYDGHLVIDHAHYEETLHGPLRIGRLHVIADATYDDFKFPDQAPDDRLKA